jgi:phosphatidylinositol glycan class O
MAVSGGGTGWNSTLPPISQGWELVLTVLFVVFHSGILTFGNSYILEEEHILMYMIAVLSIVLYLRLSITTAIATPTPIPTIYKYAPLIIPVASRIGELLISGHGQDPSVRMHSAHHAGAFLSSLFLLMLGRWYLYRVDITPSVPNTIADCCALLCLGQSWWEKRDIDPERHGFGGTRLAIAITIIGFLISICQALQGRKIAGNSRTVADSITIMIKMILLILIVTGPSSATSAALVSAQAAAVYLLSSMSGLPTTVPSPVLAALCRFITRHVFFATNHGCTFSRLQLSAAFVATTTFNFYFAGASLFINTFGWEILGLVFAWFLSSRGRPSLWRWYCLYQWIEMLCSCISVSVLRRHLMVWDIYAPHFLFVAIFMIIYSGFQLAVYYFDRNSTPQQKSE